MKHGSTVELQCITILNTTGGLGINNFQRINKVIKSSEKPQG